MSKSSDCHPQQLQFILTVRKYWDVLTPELQKKVALSALKKTLDQFNQK